MKMAIFAGIILFLIFVVILCALIWFAAEVYSAHRDHEQWKRDMQKKHEEWNQIRERIKKEDE